jgi:hypothetical protein
MMAGTLSGKEEENASMGEELHAENSETEQ